MVGMRNLDELVEAVFRVSNKVTKITYHVSMRREGYLRDVLNLVTLKDGIGLVNGVKDRLNKAV